MYDYEKVVATNQMLMKTPFQDSDIQNYRIQMEI